MEPSEQDDFLEKLAEQRKARDEYLKGLEELGGSELEEWRRMTPSEQDAFLAERIKEREAYQPLVYVDWQAMRPHQQDAFLKQLEQRRSDDQMFILQLTKKYLEFYELFKTQFSENINLSIKEDLTYLTSINKTLEQKKYMSYLTNKFIIAKIKWKRNIDNAKHKYTKGDNPKHLSIYNDIKFNIQKFSLTHHKPRHPTILFAFSSVLIADSIYNIIEYYRDMLEYFFTHIIMFHFYITIVFYHYIEEIIEFSSNLYLINHKFSSINSSIKNINDLNKKNKTNKENALYGLFDVVKYLHRAAIVLKKILTDLKLIENDLVTTNVPFTEKERQEIQALYNLVLKMETTMTQIKANIPRRQWNSYIFKFDPGFSKEYFSKALNLLSPWCLINIRNNSEGFFKNVTDVINSMVNNLSHEYENGWYFTETHGLEPKRLMETIVQSLLENYDITYGSIPNKY